MTAVLPEGREGAAAPSSFPYESLRMMSRTLDDVERARIQGGNRVGAIVRSYENAHPDLSVPVEILAPLETLKRAEEEMVDAIEWLWKQHPLASWAKTVKGVGPKSIARLLAETGDPLWRSVGHWEGEDEERSWVIDGWHPRTLAQLRSYAGHGDPARKRRKGMSQEEAFAMGNPLVKKRLWLIASGGVKSACPACRAASRERKNGDAAVYSGPSTDCTCESTHVLRRTYDEARAKYATRIETEGVRVGEPWRPARQHAAAVREVGKTFLRLLHAEATRLA